jgi:hypothetical protein
VGPPTEEKKKVPIRKFNSYNKLIEKIESGWMPADEQ